jgi:anti-anti-sigma regulatory factor
MMTAPSLPEHHPEFDSSHITPATLLIRLRGAVTGSTVDRIRRAFRSAPLHTQCAVLDTTAVTVLDPVAAARLWLACEQARLHGALEIRLVGLPAALERTLRQHPLLRLADSPGESLFDDPFSAPHASER